MIDKLSYDDILAISNDLKKQIDVVSQVTASREITQLSDFIATVEGYSKFLVNIVEINKDADAALAELKSHLK
jgi:hypothetical protein